MPNENVAPVRTPDGTVRYPDGSIHNPDGSVYDPKANTGPVFNPDGSVRAHTGGEYRAPAIAVHPLTGTYPGDPRNPYDPKFPGTAAGPVGVVVQIDDQKLSTVHQPGTTTGPAVAPTMAKAAPVLATAAAAGVPPSPAVKSGASAAPTPVSPGARTTQPDATRATTTDR